MSDAQSMIEAQGLTKFYGSVKAIQDVTFSMSRGEILGFLGPNGAGKTTTMKILTCFISPTTGTARVNGHDVFDDSIAARRDVGYLPESAPLYTDMTVLEDLRFFAEMREIEQAKREKAIRRVVEVCGLGEVVGREIRELSKGFRQRVGLAQAIVHEPDIIILDEPTSGLDPNQIVEIRSLIKELGRERTIILSTHNLSEVQAACSRVIIINRGKLVADGTVEDLSRQKGGRRHSVVTGADDLPRAREACEKVPGVRSTEPGEVSGSEATLLVFADGDADLRAELARAVVEAGLPLLGLGRSRISLEDVFRGLTLDDGRAGRRRRRPSAEPVSEEHEHGHEHEHEHGHEKDERAGQPGGDEEGREG